MAAALWAVVELIIDHLVLFLDFSHFPRLAFGVWHFSVLEKFDPLLDFRVVMLAILDALSE